MEKFIRIAIRIGKRAGYLLIAWIAFFVIASIVTKLTSPESAARSFNALGFFALLIATPIVLFKKSKASNFHSSLVGKVEKEHRATVREIRKRWDAQTRLCGLARHAGVDDKGRAVWECPRVMDVQSVSRGVELFVRPVAGQSVDHILQTLPQLENSFAAELEGEWVNGTIAKILVVMEDQLTDHRPAGTATFGG